MGEREDGVEIDRDWVEIKERRGGDEEQRDWVEIEEKLGDREIGRGIGGGRRRL
jgi:hypothetical protein